MASFGLIWITAPSYTVLFPMPADPTWKTAIFSTNAQLIGCASDPFPVSLVVSKQHVFGVSIVSGMLFSVDPAILLAVRFYLRSGKPKERQLRRFEPISNDEQ